MNTRNRPAEIKSESGGEFQIQIKSGCYSVVVLYFRLCGFHVKFIRYERKFYEWNGGALCCSQQSRDLAYYVLSQCLTIFWYLLECHLYKNKNKCVLTMNVEDLEQDEVF